jgi:hypothetical protein
MTDQGLLEMAYQIVVDRDFRERFLIAPEDVLADLGVSAETYQALIAVVPVLVAGSIGLVGEVIAGGVAAKPMLGWGRG